ncbi:MAG: DNA damage-inducible protein D [Nanoarchaeota archaeon]|nr:DNA damage-inducible protein D [Nanoarchaeota archaeon]MBU1005099.1 DNA damage-inducible protein D [Nanoarchaeota archaeon]MBU1945881.1 DNA damage-inducible protein D [Nanoarchaeota archaeon]
MNKEIILKLRKTFEDCAREAEGVEFWFARDLQILLGYDEWRNFLNVIEKAKIACKNSYHDIKDHFVNVNKKVKIGSEAEREIEDIMLTRYACYLIAQNGDPRKEEIAFAQSYFAVQTRKQELIEQRIALQERFQARNKLITSETELSKLIYERGVDDAGFARIRSKGDEALFGGNNTKQMKIKLKIPQNRPMADFLPTVTIAAKNFATEITNFNVKQNNLDGEVKITDEHVKNNKEMRRVLAKNKIIPENLPAEEDIKKLERRIKKDEKNLAETTKRKQLK